MARLTSMTSSSNDEFFKRLDDLERLAAKRGTSSSGFLRPDEVQLAIRYLGQRDDYRLSGGYTAAESRRLIIGDAEADDIVCVTAFYDDRFRELTHRDVLGALMNLGIERRQFGDLWVEGGRIVIYTTAQMADYICSNLRRINVLNVVFNISDESLEPVVKISEYTRTVASMRLDSIVKALIDVPRERAQALILHQAVAVNYATLEEKSYLCHNDDMISVRGFGRFKILEVVKTTAKGRLLLKLGKYA